MCLISVKVYSFLYFFLYPFLRENTGLDRRGFGAGVSYLQQPDFYFCFCETGGGVLSQKERVVFRGFFRFFGVCLICRARRGMLKWALYATMWYRSDINPLLGMGNE